jgi:hypothetical protein
VYPAEESKLPSKVTLLERHYESNESDNVQSEADDSVIRSKGHELCISEDNMLNER